MFRHTLAPLLAPSSVALVGATEREGALGRLVWQNLAAGARGGGLTGGLFAVNPKHRHIFGERCYGRLRDLPKVPDLAVLVTPARTVAGLLEEAGAAGVRGAVVLTSGFGEAGASGRSLQAEVLAAARRHRLRLLGPNCLGLMRTDLGLNATFSPVPALPGKLALVSQSGAICTAILDWAGPAGIGFSSVVSLGAAADVDFGEVLDFLVADPATDAILMYVEGIHDARRFISSLRTAARAKPVVALKVGRYATGSHAASSHTGALVGSDAVFDAALRRCGTVRVRTYTQLFAAARILASFRDAAGERLAILTNGGGPGVLAADSASENGVPLAELAPATLARMDASLPPQWSHGNPVDIIGDAPPQRFTEATAAVLDDPGVDALLVMYSPVAVTPPDAAARAVVEGARKRGRKPLLAAWLGDINPSETRAWLEANGVPNFYTPENAVEAFSFLCAYRRNQSQLLEVPAALARSAHQSVPDLAAARAIRDAALAERRTTLTEHEAKALLRAFGVRVPPSPVVTSREAAIAAAREIGFPVALKVHSPDITHKTEVGGVRLNLQDEAMVAGAFDGMLRSVREARPEARVEGAVVQPMLRYPHAREVLVGVATDAVFGPVISFGTGGIAVEAVRDTAIGLPPLNAVLARELIDRTRVSRLLDAYRDVPAADRDALVELLLGVSDMVCALPWIREMDLNPVIAHPGGAVIADARVVIDPARVEPLPRYGHMAIHPYPTELEGRLRLRDGTTVPVRPIRPEDAALEERFFDGLSERSRYQRFLNLMAHLPRQMVARFTQLDYDRELALVALEPGSGEFIGVGRFAPNADGETAEFALTIADAWQGRGVGRALLERICDCARAAGYRTLYGHILNANRDMLGLAEYLGFKECTREADLVTVARELQ
jgi:acetyltransferase